MMLNSTEILGASILIVDDQDANVKLLERLLREAGYTDVASTMTPQEVPSLHRRNRHDNAQHGQQRPHGATHQAALRKGKKISKIHFKSLRGAEGLEK